MPEGGWLVIAAAIVVVALALSEWRLRRQRQRMDLLAEQARERLREVTAEPAEAPAPEPLKPTATPLPVIPEHPPYFAAYEPRVGKPVRACTCHQRDLQVGRPALLWPVPTPENPDSKIGLLVFCEQGAREMQQGVIEDGSDHA